MPLPISYLIVSAIHLYLCLTGQAGKARAVTKGLLMPCLLAYVVTRCAGKPPLLLCGAILLGWAGDLLLLAPGRKGCFIGGAAAFLGGHICYAVLLFRQLDANALPMPVILLTAAGLIAIGIGVYLSLRKDLGEMRIPVIAYLLAILVMAAGAVLTLLQGLAKGSVSLPQIWIAIGGMSFLVSDYLLARGLFVKKLRLGDFWVMLSYIAAQLLLVMGLLCTSAL